MSLIHSGLDEQSAGEKAYSDVLPMLQKELESIYMECLSVAPWDQCFRGGQGQCFSCKSKFFFRQTKKFSGRQHFKSPPPPPRGQH